jgi:uncharacterized membrane protein YccC
MNERPHLIPALTAAALLVVALGHHPYGYYTFLRWAVCASALMVAWVAWQSSAQWATFPFVAIAFLFNPLAPVYMTRAHWRPVDIACAVAFVCSLAVKRRPAHVQPQSADLD